MENANIEAAVAKFVNFMTESAEQASDLAKKGADVGMTFGSELVQQVLMFHAIEGAVIGLVMALVAIFIGKFVMKNARTLSSSSGFANTARLLELAAQMEEPLRSTPHYVIKNSGDVERVTAIDSDGDGVKPHGGYIYARHIADRVSFDQYRQIKDKLIEESGNAGEKPHPLMASMHEGTDGFLSSIVLIILGVVALVIGSISIGYLIEVVKIVVAPYLYLMEYAIELKGKV